MPPQTAIVTGASSGIGREQGAFADLPIDRQLEMIQVNVTALTELTRRFLPGMLARNRGGILNVGSTAGFQPGRRRGRLCARSSGG